MEKEQYYLKTQRWTVGYDRTPILSEVNLSVKKGEILVLVGPNGAGKTTFIKSIIRQLTPLAGVAVLDENDLEKMNSGELAKKMAVVLTERLQTEYMTVEEVVETGRYPYTGRFGILSQTDHKVVQSVIEQVRIADWKQRDFNKLSDGQKQRVMLARALAQQPDILILDEPTSYLDIRYKMEFLSLLKELSTEHGLTVILSLHEVELAKYIADKIACFKDGRLTKFDSPSKVFQGDYLLELYGISMTNLDGKMQDYCRDILLEKGGKK